MPKLSKKYAQEICTVSYVPSFPRHFLKGLNIWNMDAHRGKVRGCLVYPV